MPMNLIARINDHFQENIEAHQKAHLALQNQLVKATETLFACCAAGNKVLACGNGGSAADAQHFVAELVGRFEMERNPIAAVALTTDTSILTAVANDYSYEQVFARQVQALANEQDVLIAISTSGNSPNVLAAVHAMHQRQGQVIALTGRDGGTIGRTLNENDIHLCVPHLRTARIQEIHILLLHILCDGVDYLLLHDSPSK